MLLNPHITTYKETVVQKKLGNLPEMTQPGGPGRGTNAFAPRPPLPFILHDDTFDFLKPLTRGLGRMDLTIPI